jgi:hypothetical protein
MTPAPSLHHFAYSITPHTLELVLELFEMFGCSLGYRKGDARWCIIEQKPIPVDLQLIEVNNIPVTVIDLKLNTHIAFLSDDPVRVVDMVRMWAQEKNVAFRDGGWSERELWFDLPEVFVNFVIEVMHPDIVKG